MFNDAAPVMVVAPHPDDEALGCGGTLLRLRALRPDAAIHWLIVTEMPASYGAERIATREREIASTAARLGAQVHRLGFPAATLDEVPMSDVIGRMSGIVRAAQPASVFVPWRHDVHGDHRIAFDAAVSCTKSFRYPSVHNVLAYEALSETDYALDPAAPAFRPNVFVDISEFLEAKLELLAGYGAEIQPFPFPRSREAVEALARVRGAAAGVQAAEGFVLLKGILR